MTMLTRSGAQAIREELEQLRDEYLNASATTASTQEAHDSERRLQVEQRIGALERMLARAEVVETPTRNDDPRVLFGATVTLRSEPGGESVRYRIVGEDEADIPSGLLSVASPLARALLGHERGETVSHETPNGSRTYRITEVVHGE